MASPQEKADVFHSLHKKGQPVILFNIWDPGSTMALVEAGAAAIATGSHGVANAFGYEDGEQIPLDTALSNAERVVSAAGELPVTMDVETGYGASPEDVQETIRRVIGCGVVGINIEDTYLDTGQLRPIDEQVKRIAAARAAADKAGVNIFINARTDLF